EIDNDECRLDIVAADVNDPTQWETIGRALTEAPEPSQLAFVNCAGIARFGPFADADADSIRDQISTNMFSPIMLTHEILPAMLQNGGGQI
ncbi:SDR family NAD(P)-dependent oxidoreductase, partial [Acinetobacter baumannii]